MHLQFCLLRPAIGCIDNHHTNATSWKSNSNGLCQIWKRWFGTLYIRCCWCGPWLQIQHLAWLYSPHRCQKVQIWISSYVGFGSDQKHGQKLARKTIFVLICPKVWRQGVFHNHGTCVQILDRWLTIWVWIHGGDPITASRFKGGQL